MEARILHMSPPSGSLVGLQESNCLFGLAHCDSNPLHARLDPEAQRKGVPSGTSTTNPQSFQLVQRRLLSMKQIILSLVLLFASAMAFATGNHIPQPPQNNLYNSSSSVSSGGTQRQDQQQTATAEARNQSGVWDTSNVYVLPAPIQGSNLPAGFCNDASYIHWSVVWNFISVASGHSKTDQECLSLWFKLQGVLAQESKRPVMQPLSPLTDDEKRQLQLLEEQSKKRKESGVKETPVKKKTVNKCNAPGVKKTSVKDCIIT